MVHMLSILQVCFTCNDQNLAYVRLGSTGSPKGVDVSHGNVTNALLLEPANLGIKVGSKVAQVLNVAFDMGTLYVIDLGRCN